MINDISMCRLLQHSDYMLYTIIKGKHFEVFRSKTSYPVQQTYFVEAFDRESVNPSERVLPLAGVCVNHQNETPSVRFKTFNNVHFGLDDISEGDILDCMWWENVTPSGYYEDLKRCFDKGESL